MICLLYSQGTNHFYDRDRLGLRYVSFTFSLFLKWEKLESNKNDQEYNPFFYFVILNKHIRYICNCTLISRVLCLLAENTLKYMTESNISKRKSQPVEAFILIYSLTKHVKG